MGIAYAFFVFAIKNSSRDGHCLRLPTPFLYIPLFKENAAGKPLSDEVVVH
jgi:hypothetical protein